MSRPAAWAPFQTRSFRFQWPADLCTAWALEMETLILGWYVLVASDSVVLLTVFGALMYVGTLLSPMLGMLGDRLGLRQLLTAMRLSYALFAGLILSLSLLDRLDPAAVLVLAFMAGLIKPSDIGMRTALVSATVPQQHLVAAMGIARTTHDSARIAGALVGTGFMAAFGLAPAYAFIVSVYVVGLLLTWQVRDPGHPPAGSSGLDGSDAKAGHPVPPVAPQASLSASVHASANAPMNAPMSASVGVAAAAAPDGLAVPVPVPRKSPWRELQEGLLHVWQTPRLLAAMCVAMLVNLTAFPLAIGLMPYIAREVFQQGQRGLGWLVASFACGALVGSVSLSLLGHRVRPGQVMLAACVAWYLCLAGLMLPIGLPVAMALLVGAGLSQSLSMLSLAIILLRTVAPRFRGRVMGVRMLAIYTLPLGLLSAGQMIPVIGFRATVALFVATGLLMTLAVAMVWRAELLPHAALANQRS